MSDRSVQKAGRKYTVDGNGITSLKKDFTVILDNVMAENGETLTFPGVPLIGAKHPTYQGLYVKSYDVQEGAGSDKKTLTVTVNYGTDDGEEEPEGEGNAATVVTDWGWEDNTDEKELTTGVDGTPVLNSAGDPFESVPKVMAPAPTFVKVMKTKQRQSGWASAFCCVNQNAMTVGGLSCPAGSLLCTVSEKRIIGDRDWKYQYTVKLRYKSNPVKINGGEQLTDIGWDVAIADAGMRELVSGEKKLIRVIDKETGKPCTVMSAALLNGQGVAATGENVKPYNFRFQAYPRASFPNWFYSEPSLQEEGL